MLEALVRPLLELLDGTGLFATAWFAPLYRLVAALTVVILVAYLVTLAFRPLDRQLDRLLKVRVIGRLVALVMAGWITAGVLGDASFVLDRGGRASEVVSSNLGFLLILGLLVFLEVRLLRMGRRR